MPLWMRRVLWGCVLVASLAGLPLILHLTGVLPAAPPGGPAVCSLPMPRPLGHIPSPHPHHRQVAVSRR